MNIFKLAFELFLVYLAYKLIFEFVIPVYKTTKQMKQKMNEMHQKMQQQDSFNKEQAANSFTSQKKVPNEDYIDYEEIK